MHRQHRVLVLALVAMALAWAGTAAPAWAEREHCGTITSNETWTAASNPHFVKCTVLIRNSTVTIEPGAIVLMNEGTDLVVQSGSSLQAVGDPQIGNIAFRGNSAEEQPGFWGQLRFESGAEPSRLDQVIVRGGGRGGLPMIEVQDTVAVVVRAQVRQSAGPALGFWPDALGPSLDEAGQATTNYECKGNPHPLLILDRDATLSVEAGEHHVTQFATWHHFCAPYLVKGDLVVAGPEEPALELNRGTTLKFEPSAALVVGLSAEQPGQLQTSGDPELPVVLTGQADAPGSWRGLRLSEFSSFNSLITTRIENGGAGDEPMVRVDSLDSSALDVQFRKALGYPIAARADGVGRFLSGSVGQDSPPMVDNGIQRVLVLTNPAGEDLTIGAAEWPDTGVPYELDGDLTIGNQGIPAGLTVAAGATLLFRPGATLELAEAGALVAKGSQVGTRDVPVTFGALSGAAGGWRGIVVGDGADLAQLDLTVVENGGAGGEPMLHWGDADGTVTRSTFRGAPGYPVSIPLSVAPDVIMGADQVLEGQDYRNRFTGNGVDRVLVRVDGPVTSARLKLWADPGGPVEFDGSVAAASTAGPRLEWRDGLDLRFRPGAAFLLAGPGQKGNVEVLNEDPELPVRLGPVDPAAGWAGFKLLPGASLKGADLDLAGAPAGVANLLADGATVDMTGLVAHGEGAGIGLDATGAAQVSLSGSRFTGLEIGLRTRSGARLDLTKSVVQGNRDWGIRNEDPNTCQRALQVWWGVATGPRDDSEAHDGCMNAKNVSAGGDRVSDDVEWWPYAINDSDFAPSPGIGPNAKRIFLPWAFR